MERNPDPNAKREMDRNPGIAVPPPSAKRKNRLLAIRHCTGKYQAVKKLAPFGRGYAKKSGILFKKGLRENGFVVLKGAFHTFMLAARGSKR